MTLKGCVVIIIGVYAPSEDKRDEVKEQFYYKLNAMVESE